MVDDEDERTMNIAKHAANPRAGFRVIVVADG
jgi:hypothetical protein